MSDTGAKFPSIAASVSETPWDDNAWTDAEPTNLDADDGATASVTPANFDDGDQTHVLKAYGFDFSEIADGSQIDGIECVANTWYADGSASFGLMQLLDTSLTRIGDNQCATPVPMSTDTATTITKGGPTDTWNANPTAAMVKHSNFGVGMGCIATQNNADVFIDYVTLKIYYTTPAGDSLVSVQRSIKRKNWHVVR